MGEKMEPGQKKELGWLGYLNKQGLMKPTPEFTALLKKFEIIFKQFHGESLAQIYDPIDQFFQILKNKFKDTPTEILFFLFKSKIFYKIKTFKQTIRFRNAGKSKKTKCTYK
jgi:hypothetical protein